MPNLDTLDRQILDTIQKEFPLSSRPYHDIAKTFEVSAEEIMKKITHLKEIGVIRQLSAIFDTRKLGYTSSLVAMKVESDKIEEIAKIINKHPGVSHNYERIHEFNLWFTLAVPPGVELKLEVDNLSKIDGVISIRMLPTIKMFKIGVKLDMVDKQKIEPTEQKQEFNNSAFDPTEKEKEFVRELQKDLKVVERPFASAVNALNMTENEIFAKLKEYQRAGVMRRYAAILRHRDIGFVANGMIVWKVPEDKIDMVGEILGSFSQVSHCYQRPVYSDWKYNVFSMIHCKTQDEAKQVAKEIQKFVNVEEYTILFSAREFKKTRVEYFVDTPKITT
ncbi:MAG: Lrp/AsnC family transcriptional regulator [Candidatus Nitrosoabyssus spongiisocia]|nr:MAG: Lrp/AsnC family transcriptional regulator [Nitrosopumilaceae archaeon AB1(1)]